jgi:acetyl-CoA carboxylase biotin carboxyl carrier protein
MNFENVKDLIKTIDNSGITEFELNLDNATVRISKNTLAPEHSPASKQNTEEHNIVAESKAPPPDREPKQNTANVGEAGHIIKAPIVGTFYSRPSGNAESYVKIGDSVEKGDTLCILEAMKIMNEIKSDKAGVISDIYVENESMVEYGQPLFCVL